MPFAEGGRREDLICRQGDSANRIPLKRIQITGFSLSFAPDLPGCAVKKKICVLGKYIFPARRFSPCYPICFFVNF